MLRKVREQRPIEVFLTVLGELVRHQRVRLDQVEDGFAPVIGRLDARTPRAHWVSSELSLAEVQRFLARGGWPTRATCARWT
jgi:hypothetical protein